MTLVGVVFARRDEEGEKEEPFLVCLFGFLMEEEEVFVGWG